LKSNAKTNARALRVFESVLPRKRFAYPTKAQKETIVTIRQERSTNLVESISESVASAEQGALNEETFKRVIAIERKRTERSKSPFVLMLLEVTNHQNSEKAKRSLECIVTALVAACRDTDLVGWYKDNCIVGVMFTGLVVNDKHSILSAILNRVSETLRNELTFEQFSQISISFHLFPDDWEDDKPGRPSNSALYPDLTSHDNGRKSLLIVKRSIDIAGSAVLTLICLPLFLAIAIAVRWSSKGPILFRQERVGQFGQIFTFLKFRSMYVDNDHTVHREFVTKLIAEEAVVGTQSGSRQNVYKLTNDKRVTAIGRFLRRTSLDELPQLFNVLKGDMSLVGPRPPIPYELAAYQVWHRRRVLEVKPGITGLWQVTGRSRVKFDEMVRLDLRYATTWTPWLDLMILLRTPVAVIKGSGAY
jgi:lipopolysaccharide/colanic/teichoic acid biosynthesis glycosyltransferase